MVIMGVSTAQTPPRVIRDSISYETRGEYFLIKIETRRNPNNYQLFDARLRNREFIVSFYHHLRYWQLFRKDVSGVLITELFIPCEEYEWKTELLKKIILNDEDIGAFTEGNYFIIKIRSELLMHENPHVRQIFLTSRL